MPNTSNQDVKPINKVSTNFALGENVRIIATNYSTGQIIPTWVKKSSYPIIQVGQGKCLLGNGLDSWVDDDGLEPVRAFSVGDKVKVIGSNYATGQAIPEWVKSNIYTIQELTNTEALLKEIESWVYLTDLVKSNIVVGAKVRIKSSATNYATGEPIQLTNTEALLKEIESWVYLTDLVKSNIVVGAKVRIKSSATNYATGEPIPNWVKENSYTIEQITNNKALLKEIESWLYLNDLQEY